MIYAKVENNVVVETQLRPKWIDASTGELVSDLWLVENESLYQVMDNIPVYKPSRQSLQKNDKGLWIIHADHVEVTYTVTDKPLADVKALRKQEINRAYEDELNAILKDYPDVETKTWDKQEQEARAWAADNTASTPLLTEIANARGMTLAELVPRVIAKADAWVQLSGAATGKRQALEAAIGTATTVEEVEAIQW